MRRCFCTLAVILFCVAIVQSQEIQPDSPGTEAEQPIVETTSLSDTSRYADPNKIPYRTNKSLLVHFLSLPASLWHLAWTPVGSTVIWAEQNRVPQKVSNFFFLNKEKTAAVFPLVSLGGNTGAGIGVMAFHANLFGKRKFLRGNFLFSGTDNNSAGITYRDSTLFGSGFYFDLSGNYFNDSDENLYISDTVSVEQLLDSSISANDSDEEDETSYALEELSVLATFGYALSERVGLGMLAGFRRADTDAGEEEEGLKFPDNIPGRSPASLVTVGGELTFNFTKGWPRVLSGPLLRMSYTYNREVGGEQFEYNRFRAEAQQFIPLPFLARNRRLAVRAIFEKIDRIGDKQVPFYELSVLGDAADLRGFDQNRFRGRGLLLFNFEYRYPVWDLWDAVIFLDQGQVYDDLSDLGFDAFHTAVGTGIRFMSPMGFLMRVEVARSTEQWRALFQITPNF